jgi:hypothetical protein
VSIAASMMTLVQQFDLQDYSNLPNSSKNRWVKDNTSKQTYELALTTCSVLKFPDRPAYGSNASNLNIWAGKNWGTTKRMGKIPRPVWSTNGFPYTAPNKFSNGTVKKQVMNRFIFVPDGWMDSQQ